MTHYNVNYAASYFKYKTPTPIQGILTNKALNLLNPEVRAKTTSIVSNLGGGDY